MTQPKPKIAILAPNALLNAFQILLHSTPELEVIAADVCLEAIQEKIQKRIPDTFIIYLTGQHLCKQYECVSVEEIGKIKTWWPAVKCIAIVNNTQQRDKAKAMGADATLLEGVTPSRLIATINNLSLHNDQGSKSKEVNSTE